MADQTLSSIEVKYVRDTPSTLKLAAGDHKVKVEKSGFTIWEKTLTVSAGTFVTVNPTSDKE